MAAKWTTYTLDRAENEQDPIQHWLLVPSPSNEDGHGYRDLIVAYVFRFASSDVMARLREAFEPSGGDRGLFFPDLDPLALPETDEIIAVGFSRLGNLTAIHEALSGDGELLVTGVPIRDFSVAEAGDTPKIAVDDDDLVGIIDTDIAFANSRFRRDPKHTRIAAFWDQDAEATTALPLILGRAIGSNAIDALLQAFDQDGNVDEASLYAAYYQDTYPPDGFPRLPTRIGHGTHVLDVIAGGEGATEPILAVDLRNRAVDATHGLLLFPWVVLGLLWMLQLAGHDRRPLINFSFGGMAGRHDGQGPLELIFDAILNGNRASAITIPAGNFYDTRTHAAFRGDELDDPRTLRWMVQPNDGTSNIVEMWLPNGTPGTAQVSLTLRPPRGPELTIDDATIGVFHELKDGAEIIARIYVQRVAFLGAAPRVRIAIFARHTSYWRDYFQFSGGAPDLAGAWDITLRRCELADDARVNLWIERDDALGLARNGARQSYFDAPRPVWPERAPQVPVRNDGAMSDIATGARTLVAAGSVRASRQPARYSSESFDHPVAFPPTAAAISDDSRLHAGVLASGFFSGSTVSMNGTSVAAAMLGRKVSDRIAAQSPVDRADIEALAASEDGRTIPDSAPIHPLFQIYEPTPPKTRIGSGCLDAPWTRLPRFQGR